MSSVEQADGSGRGGRRKSYHKFLKNEKARLERRSVKEALFKEEPDSVPKRFTRGYET